MPTLVRDNEVTNLVESIAVLDTIVLANEKDVQKKNEYFHNPHTQTVHSTCKRRSTRARKSEGLRVFARWVPSAAKKRLLS